MTNSGLSRRRVLQQTSVRLALAVIAAALGYVAVIQALAMVVQKRSPALAHELAPRNGLITAEFSRKLFGIHAVAKDRVQADRMARLALRQDPTAIDAAAILGLNAQIYGHTSLARRLFAYVQALSRRNLQTQLWAISDAISRNDLSSALIHYDIALRTSPDASSLLFPTLAMALADPTIRTGLARTLARQPSWANAFMGYAVGNADPQTMASLFQLVSHFGGIVPDGDSATIINALSGAGKLDQAWAYYASLHPDASPRTSRDPSFENSTQAPSLFDWTPLDDGSISASIQPKDRQNGVLTFAAPPSVGGQVVRQLEMLPVGDYILEGRSEGIIQPDDARPYWSVSCNGGRELGRVVVPNSAVANGLFRGRITVPADCPIQVLALDVQPSSSVSGITGQIDRALLRPVE